jgi:hypothetical protein
MAYLWEHRCDRHVVGCYVDHANSTKPSPCMMPDAQLKTAGASRKAFEAWWTNQNPTYQRSETVLAQQFKAKR